MNDDADIALLIMTDGRGEMLKRTLASFAESIGFDHISCIMVNDDSADPSYARLLEDLLHPYLGPAPIFVCTTQERSGFGGAIRNAWTKLAEYRRAPFQGLDYDWVFHLEDDFTFPEPIDLADMLRVMEANPHLAQLALRRQPWGSDLQYAGGFIEAQPDHYTERHVPGLPVWIETTRNWTTNPALFRHELLDGGWPDDPFSEGKYGFVLKEQGLPWGIEGGDVRFGIWGGIYDSPSCWHIGDYRVGTLY